MPDGVTVTCVSMEKGRRGPLVGGWPGFPSTA